MTPERYGYITQYIAARYPAALFERHGTRHPVTFYEAAPHQVQDVDSILGRVPSKTLTRSDFDVYNYAYLHSLQNSARTIYDGTTFALTHLRTRPLRIEAAFGSYFDMIATCAALDQELQDAANGTYIRAPQRSHYHRSVTHEEALTRGTGRSAAIGGIVLTVFNDEGTYRLLLGKRSAKQATRPNHIHLLPAFMFQPLQQPMHPQEWSLRHHVYREVLEELFGLDESDSLAFYDHPALVALQHMMDAGQAGLYVTGIALNLMTLRPEITMLLLIRDPQWWQRVHAPDSPFPLAINDESSAFLTAPIATDEALLAALPPEMHLITPPHAVAGLWKGVDLARELLKAADE